MLDELKVMFFKFGFPPPQPAPPVLWDPWLEMLKTMQAGNCLLESPDPCSSPLRSAQLIPVFIYELSMMQFMLYVKKDA